MHYSIHDDYEIHLADVPVNAKRPRFLRVKAQVHLRVYRFRGCALTLRSGPKTNKVLIKCRLVSNLKSHRC